MSIFKQYADYIKNNPQHYWFKRKLYGWGWTPATWQGWVVTLLYIFLVLGFAFTVDESSPPEEMMFTFVMPMVFLTFTFILIAYKKGEKPRWQWGLKDAEIKDDK